MSIIVYVFEIKEIGIHLAVELTSIQKTPEDPCANYISYYEYYRSEISGIENQRHLERFHALRGCGGYDSGMAVTSLDNSGLSPLILKESKFGFNSKKSDIRNLKLLRTIRIPTQEDKFESAFSEESIAKKWREARPVDQKAAVEQKECFKFSINDLHCGTVVRNVLENKPLNTRREEEKDKDKNKLTKPIIIKSLSNTIQLASDLSQQLFKINKDSCTQHFFKEDIRLFYNYYRSHKSFWERDSQDYKILYSLGHGEKSLIPTDEIPKNLLIKLSTFIFETYKHINEEFSEAYKPSI